MPDPIRGFAKPTSSQGKSWSRGPLRWPSSEIAAITSHAAQARLLRELITDPGIEIYTIDGFQDREKKAVVISLVRSNTTAELGFLTDTRRTNVALTRARRKLKPAAN